MNKLQRFKKANYVRRLPSRRLISIFACAFALLIWTAAPALASYTGQLKSSVLLTVEVTASSGNAGPTAVTVTYLSKRGQSVDFGFVPPGGGASVVDLQPIPRGTKLVIVEVDPPVGGTAFLRVLQGANLPYEDQVLSDARFVYEVVD